MDQEFMVCSVLLTTFWVFAMTLVIYAIAE